MNTQYPGDIAVSPKQATPYDIHQSAAREWAEACQEFQRVSERRIMAEKRLAEATQNLAQHMQMVNQDPTGPAMAMPQAPGNGQIGALQRW